MIKRPIGEVLVEFADRIEAIHGEDSDWWKGYIAGMRRAASLVEAHEAFVESHA